MSSSTSSIPATTIYLSDSFDQEEKKDHHGYTISNKKTNDFFFYPEIGKEQELSAKYVAIYGHILPWCHLNF